jgi:anti-sigma-K factor RskA/putative zinc finger protein
MTALTCDQCEDLLPGYLLGALTPEEAAAAAEHLHTCVRCQASQLAYEAVLERLGEAIGLQAPPPTVQQSLMATVQADLIPMVGRRRVEPRRRWSAWTVRWGAVWAVATAVLLLGLGWGAWQAWNTVTQMRANEQALVHQLDMQRQALAILTASDSRRVVLSAEGRQARGVLLLRETTPDAVLIVLDLPQLQPDRGYQLWLAREGGRDDGGVFQVDERGFGMLRIHAPNPLATYRAVGITEEPVTGSPGPTSPRVIGSPLKP